MNIPPSPPPFVVMAMPRARSFWLSKFLAPPGRSCGHEELRHARNLADVTRWLGQPWTGTVETAAAPWWRTLRRMAPEAKLAIVRREPEDVVDSFARMRLDFNLENLRHQCHRLAAKLDQVALRCPEALVVDFEDLELEDCCAEVFEHCTGIEHSPDWWRWHHETRLEGDIIGLLRYLVAFAEPIAQVTREAKLAELAAFERRPRPRPTDDPVVGVEALARFKADGARVFARHCELAGLASGAWEYVNWGLYQQLEDSGRLQLLTARTPELVGYLLTVIGPSFDDIRVCEATTVMQWADSRWPGLGRRMARESVARLREGSDATELIWQTGPLADGPRLGLLARRLGAIQDGQIWRLNLRGPD